MAVHHKPVPTAKRRQRAGVPVEVCESGEGRALLLGTDTVQSLMNVEHPSELVLSYTRAMMGGLLIGTLVVLLFLPALYALFFGIKNK